MTGWRTLYRRYLGRDPGSVAMMTILLALTTTLAVAGPLVLGRFVDGVEARRTLPLLLHLAYLYLAVTVLAGAARVLAGYFTERVAWRTTNALREDLTAHLLALPLAYFRHRSAGEMVERVDGDINALAGFLSGLAFKLGGSLLLIAGTLAALFIVSPAVMMVLAVLTAGLGFLLERLRRRSTPLFFQERVQNARTYGTMGEVLEAKDDLRALGREDWGERQVYERLRDWGPWYIRAERWGMLLWLSVLAGFGLGTGLAYAVSGHLYLIGRLPLGSVYAATAYAGMLAEPFETIRGQLEDLQKAGASLLRVGELFREQPGPRPLVHFPRGPLGVQLVNVSLSYEGHAALRGVSASIAPGRRVVVEGRTGSGKTSLARLLAGLYEPDTGMVEVGGGPPAAFAEGTLRSHVLYLPQRPWFVGGTIRENLAAEAGVREDDRLLEALARMGLAEWVERAGGLDSMLVREHLSLGEASLLHLARAFLTDPGLVILDEPTAALDPATERRVMGHLDRYLNGRTAVLITHRTTLRALGDELWRLGGGRLVEQTPLRRVQREDLR